MFANYVSGPLLGPPLKALKALSVVILTAAVLCATLQTAIAVGPQRIAKNVVVNFVEG